MKCNVQIVECSSNRCNNCPHYNEIGCQRLVPEKQNQKKATILVEKSRGLIHVRFSGEPILIEPPWFREGWESIFVEEDDELFNGISDMLDIHRVYPYVSCFIREQYQVRYRYLPIAGTALELSLLKNLVNEYQSSINRKLMTRERLTRHLESVRKNVLEYINKQIPEINERKRLRLAILVAHQTNILGRVFPILMDEMTEEVYLDGPDSPLYFDHQQMGRCITSIQYTQSEIPRIVTFLRSESNLHLDRSNPSLKTELDIFGTILRISASVFPLSSEGLSIEIRRARKQPFTIGDLIANETMTEAAAAILLLAVVSRLNITITGGPGTGKTTILNALDSVTPRWWRKVYIEDAIESRTIENHHQVRLQVDPFDENHKKLNKSDEIIKCLHRSPDYLILGEIQTAEHSKALFQAIAAGLHSIQTCHSDSAANLISRWIQVHKIDKSNLGLMDLIVTLDRPKPGESSRKIKEIVEIRKGVKDGILTFLGTNIVYNSIAKSVGDFAEDGAFQVLAKSIGIDSHKQALDSLLISIQKNGTLNLEKISENMWVYGHPMRFVV